MSLPVIKTLADCADFHKTVLPYLPQLYDLPRQVFQDINNLQALKVLYISTNPLVAALAFSLFLAPIFLIASEVNKNYSQVDRCWSILPTIYNAHFVLYAHAAGLPTKRLDIMMLFSGVWSVIFPDIHSLENNTSLTSAGSLDIQLLAQRWLQYWLRGLSMGGSQRIY